MKLHDLRPAEGAHRPRTRVGRGIAAGQGKTAGRGTKGQKARAGASIPPWFEGGQTPLSQRIPKLRGFRNRFKVQYEVVNVGRIAELVERGRLQPGEMPGAKSGSKAPEKAAPITINQDILRAAGLVRTLRKPLKVLGSGEVGMALFVVADAITAGARQKIEAAGGSVQLLEVPVEPTTALGLGDGGEQRVEPMPATEEAAPAQVAGPEPEPLAEPGKPARRARARAAGGSDRGAQAGPASAETSAPEPAADGDAETGSATTDADA